MVEVNKVVCEYFPTYPNFSVYEVYKSYVIELYTKFGIRLNILEFLDTKHIYVFNNPHDETLNILKKFGTQEKELINECLNKINLLCSLFENENLFYKIMFSDVLKIPKAILENLLTLTKQ